jgi:hypothetical protein
MLLHRVGDSPELIGVLDVCELGFRFKNTLICSFSSCKGWMYLVLELFLEWVRFSSKPQMALLLVLF